MDEESMTVWHQCLPNDVVNKRELYAQRRAERTAERSAYREDWPIRKEVALFNIEPKEASTWDDDDERWNGAFIMMSESEDTTKSEEDDKEYFLATDFSIICVNLFVMNLLVV
ncbi:hypothetical protein D1007_07947 [Hordeum vulgare]|nr:hypothetical protein D1007_07947 [Hordeum vulgare]